MATDSSFLSTKRYAVVTGGNKGIGLEICRQLASKGVVVVLTARDENRGRGAVEKLKSTEDGISVEFHQLDVADPVSVASLADFIKTQFGKLDILTDITAHTGYATAKEGAESPVRIALLPKGESSGIFFVRKEPVPF